MAPCHLCLPLSVHVGASRPPAEEEADRAASKPERFTEVALEVAPVRAGEELRVVAEDGNRRRRDRYLRAVVDSALPARRRRRWLLPAHTVLQHLVHHRRRHAPAVLLGRSAACVEDIARAHTGLGGDIEALGPGDLWEPLLQVLLRAAVQPLVLVGHEVPFIDEDDARPAGLCDEACEAALLFRDALGSVDDKEADVGAPPRLERAPHHQLLHALIDARCAPHARSVDEDELSAMVEDVLVDGIAGGARLIAHDSALGAGEPVEQGGLAHVRPAKDRHAKLVQCLAAFVVRVERREWLDELIHHITHASAVQPANWPRCAEAEGPEVRGLELAIDCRLALVHRQHHRHLLPSEEGSDLLVEHCAARLTVDNHQHRGSLGHGDHGLLADLRQKHIMLVVVVYDTSRVNHGELVAVPEPLPVRTVARHARLIEDEASRGKLFGQTVGDRRLSHVRSADHGDGRLLAAAR
mmetsp:Transcript_54303/g.140222  ORF Transcript_54303/g.140222 Transcript_54303/m.140222 type:complete len:468 (+) Transcript_54303:322-1725(+)